MTNKFPELTSRYLYHLADNLIQLKRESNPYIETREVVKETYKEYLKEIITGKISWKMKYAYLRCWFEKRKMIDREEEQPGEDLFL